MQHFVRGSKSRLLISPVINITAHHFTADFRCMAETLTIEIPVRKHLLKFYRKEFKTKLTMADPMGIMLYYMLKDKKADRYSAELLRKFPDKIELEISQYWIERKWLSPYLTNQGVYHLDTILNDYFKRALVKWISIQVEAGCDRKVAIEQFANHYDILESDISFEGLKKADFRYRISQKAA